MALPVSQVCARIRTLIDDGIIHLVYKGGYILANNYLPASDSSMAFGKDVRKMKDGTNSISGHMRNGKCWNHEQYERGS